MLGKKYVKKIDLAEKMFGQKNLLVFQKSWGRVNPRRRVDTNKKYSRGIIVW